MNNKVCIHCENKKCSIDSSLYNKITVCEGNDWGCEDYEINENINLAKPIQTALISEIYYELTNWLPKNEKKLFITYIMRLCKDKNINYEEMFNK